MTKLRRYCWRVGAALDLAEGERCPECGVFGHLPLEDQSACGNYVEGTARFEGKHSTMRCFLPVGHAGACASEVSTLAALEPPLVFVAEDLPPVHYPARCVVVDEDGNE